MALEKMEQVFYKLHDELLKAHQGEDIGYKVHVKLADNEMSAEVYKPKEALKIVKTETSPKNITVDEIWEALKAKGVDITALKMNEEQGVWVIRKSRKIEKFQELTDAVKALGGEYINYDAKDKEHTGLWRIPQ